MNVQNKESRDQVVEFRLIFRALATFKLWICCRLRDVQYSTDDALRHGIAALPAITVRSIFLALASCNIRSTCPHASRMINHVSEKMKQPPLWRAKVGHQGRSQRGTQGGLEGNVTVKRSHEGEARARWGGGGGGVRGHAPPKNFCNFRLQITHFAAFSAWNFAGRARPIPISVLLCQ